MDFLAAVLEREGLERVFGAAFFDDAGGEKLGEEEVAIGRPVERVYSVGEELIATSKFIALENAAALAIGVLNKDVVVLKVVFFGFDVAADGVDDAAVGGEAESGDLVVDVLERLVEVLGARNRGSATKVDEKKHGRTYGYGGAWGR